MYPYLMLATYLLIIFGIFAFLIILRIQLKQFEEFSSYLLPIFRALIVLIFVITLFGSYKILTSDNNINISSNPAFDITSGTRNDF